VYQVGSSTNSIEITHSNYGAGGEFTRLTVLEGAPRETLRQGDDSVIYKSKSEKVLIEKRRIQSGFPAVLPKNTAGIKANYQVQTGGIERAAGREAHVLTLVPRDKNRYSSKLWVDKDTGLLLKLALLSDKNEVVEQVGFNHLALFSSANMDWFRPSEAPNKPHLMQPEEKVIHAAEAENWTLSALPQGFNRIEKVNRTTPGKNMVTHLVFCDGLTTVSMFLEPVKNSARKQGLMTQGATSMYVTNVDNHQVVVVGEVPPVTAIQFANTIKFK
jgi:sigma-E factor negative regulatory protein RseB